MSTGDFQSMPPSNLNDLNHGEADVSEATMSGTATAALWLGILGLLTACVGVGFVLGLIALILGLSAAREITMSAGRLKGSGRANTGAILGGLAVAFVPIVIFLGILAAIVVPQFVAVPATTVSTSTPVQAQVVPLTPQTRAQVAAAQTTQRMLRSQLELYRAMKGNYPPSLDQLVTEGFIASNPNHDPSAAYEFQYNPNTGDVTIIRR